jgi:DNA-binding GntR family transcriptional regulator
MAPNKKLECLEDLRTRILSLEIAPGSDLDESTLTDIYGISRTPLREILQRLAGEGYIRIEENRGAKVASMDLAIMRTFFQTAPLIYANIARLAAENRTSIQLDKLKEIQRKFSQATQSNEASKAALLNHQFHELIGAMAQNPYLVASLNRMLIDHTRLSQTFYRPSSRHEQELVEKASGQHDAMISAIEAREGPLVIDLTLQHWDLSRDRMEQYVKPDPLPLDVVSLKDIRTARKG